MTIYIFYNNDPLGDDQGGGVNHLRSIYRLLKNSDENFKIIACASHGGPNVARDQRVEYVSKGANVFRYFLRLFWWFLKNRAEIKKGDVFHFHRNYLAWPKYLLSPVRGRVILTYHTYTGEILKEWLPPVFARAARWMMLKAERRAVKLADFIIFVSARVRADLFASNLAGIDVATKVIPAVHETELFTVPPSLSGDLSNRLLCIGRLSAVKNFDLAIDTLEYLQARGRDFHLMIVGEGELREALEKRISKSPCRERIKLTGLIPHKRIPEVYADNGMLLMTSKSEASPTVVKEALAARRFVVTTDVGDVNEWVANGVNGFVCQPNPGELSEAILRCSQKIENGDFKENPVFADMTETSVMQKLLEVYTCTDWTATDKQAMG